MDRCSICGREMKPNPLRHLKRYHRGPTGDRVIVLVVYGILVLLGLLGLIAFIVFMGFLSKAMQS